MVGNRTTNIKEKRPEAAAPGREIRESVTPGPYSSGSRSSNVLKI